MLRLEPIVGVSVEDLLLPSRGYPRLTAEQTGRHPAATMETRRCRGRGRFTCL
jgi:hypothetical protein